MKIAAVIAEYNPFHNGHLYLFNEIRRRTDADCILVMMSGDFVQRGEPACIDKYTRCRMALDAGADIVCELPAYGALGSAEIFASSAVALLNQLSCIDYLCFGAETVHPEYLEEIAITLADEPEEYRTYLREALKTGMNFPAARSHSLGLYYHNHDYSDILNQPNNILAIEYLKALHKTNSKIKYVPITRVGAGYHDAETHHSFSSATAIRRQLADSVSTENLQIPDSCKLSMQHYIKEKGLLASNDFSLPLIYRLLDPHIQLTDYVDVTEDIANRINNNKQYFTNIDTFIQQLCSRNLTATRISRCLYHILLGHTNQTLQAWKNHAYTGYLRVLGFSTASRHFWKEIPDAANACMITRTAAAKEQLHGIGLELFNADLYASRLYRQMLRSKYQITLPDIASEPLIIKKS